MGRVESRMVEKLLTGLYGWIVVTISIDYLEGKERGALGMKRYYGFCLHQTELRPGGPPNWNYPADI